MSGLLGYEHRSQQLTGDDISLEGAFAPSAHLPRLAAMGVNARPLASAAVLSASTADTIIIPSSVTAEIGGFGPKKNIGVKGPDLAATRHHLN
jgi:hypothetical protein